MKRGAIAAACLYSCITIDPTNDNPLMTASDLFKPQYIPAHVLVWAMLLTILIERPAPFVLGAGLIGLLVSIKRGGNMPLSTISTAWQQSSGGFKRLAIIVAVLALLAVVSTLWALNPPHTFTKALRNFAIIAVGFSFLLLARLPYDRNAAIIFLSGTVAASAILLAALGFSIAPPHELVSYYNRGTLVAILTALVGFYFLSASDVSPGLRLAGRAAIVLPLMLVLYLSESQTALLVAMLISLIGFLVWLARQFRPFIVSLVISILAIAAAGCLWWGVTNDAAYAQMVWMADRANIPERWNMWVAFTNVALEKPFFGWGMKAAVAINNDMMQQLNPALANIWLDFIHPHNAVVQIALEFGLLGLALVTLGLLAALRILMSHGAERLQLTLPLSVGVLVAFFISHGAWQSWWIASIFALYAIVPTTEAEQPANA